MDNFIRVIVMVVLAHLLSGCDAPEQPENEIDTETVAVVERSKRPNIILMMSDDQGWGDVEYERTLAPGQVVPGHPLVKTPNLAAMAKAGLKFNRMYAGASVCSPTRASFVTGRAPRRTSVDWAYNDGLKNLELTIAELAKTQGYTTGHFGKWHLGDLTKTLRDRNGGEFYSPTWDHGYDRNFTSEQALPTYEPMKRDQNGPLPSEDNFHGGRCYTGPGQHVDIDSPGLRGDSSAILVREAIEFIDDAVAAKRPFFAVIWFHPPHTPHRVHPEALAEFYSKEEQLAMGCPGVAPVDESLDARTAARQAYECRYYSGITDMDKQIGRLRAHLKKLGIENDTLVAFTSDNGLSSSTRLRHQEESKGGLRGFKGELWEGGVRVPGIMEWPGQIAAGETSTPMVTSDYLPTLLDIWGIDMPDARPLDGESMTTVLFDDRSAKRAHPIAFDQCGDRTDQRGPEEPTDCDTRRAGNLLMRVGGMRSIIDDRYKLITDSSGREWELYNLATDPGETSPIAGSKDIATKPEAVRQVFHDLRERINQWWEKDTAKSRIGGDYDIRVAAAEGIDILGDVGDQTVPDDMSVNRRSERPELVVERQYAALDGSLEMDGNVSIADGTVVHSFLFRHAPDSKPGLANVTIEFDVPIIGIAENEKTLRGSDFLAWADPEFGSGRGAFSSEGDAWEVLDDGKTIAIKTRADISELDELRILTRASLQPTR